MFTKADIEKYFNAEKSESLLFIIIGLAAIALALIFFFYLKSNWYKGFAIPLLVIGLLQFVAGTTVYRRCDEDRKRTVYAYDMNPGELKDKELPRMQRVNRNFIIYRYTEIILLLAGAGLFFYFRNIASQTFWFGFGVALVIEATLTLCADLVAERRAQRYTEGIQSYTAQLK